MEIEVKFYVSDLAAFQRRLEISGARLLEARAHELNLRFDTSDRKLESNHQVLRLRQDRFVLLTYKGPGEMRQGVRHREEIEFRVGNFEAARSLLEALGYQVSWIYEKHRTVYGLGESYLMVDELPFGNFVEIEGPSVAALQQGASELGLRWEARDTRSYQALFEQAREAMKLDFRDLTFENFAPFMVTADILGVEVADQAG